jgi:hypothetical protein
VKRMHLIGAVALLLVFLGTAHANVMFFDPGFERPGPNGPTVRLVNNGETGSAASGWEQIKVSGSFMLTTHAASTDPFPGGGDMLVIDSDGPSTGKTGNTLSAGLVDEQNHATTAPVGSKGSIDINLISGFLRLGFVNSVGGGTAFDSGSVGAAVPIGPTNGWQQVSFSNLDFSSGAIEIQLYAPQGGEAVLWVDNVAASTVPEPALWLSLAVGLGLLSLMRYANWSAAHSTQPPRGRAAAFPEMGM